jgi:hypothetical protein
MTVSGLLRTSAALLWTKEFLVSTGQEAGWSQIPNSVAYRLTRNHLLPWPYDETTTF